MGKINAYDKIVMKKKKKKKIWKFKKFIYSLLMRADAIGSADTIYCM